jgi:diacylglycerol kinase family enzyme
MAGAGFDAEVARIYQTVRAGKSRPYHYVLPILRTLKDFNLPRIRVVMDGEELTDSAASVIVGNTRAYAILMAVAAHAQPDDGLLDACIFFGRTRKDMALAVLNVLFRCHLATESTLYRVGRKISLRSESPVLVQLDGDFVGCLPLDIEVKPLAVSFFVP